MPRNRCTDRVERDMHAYRACFDFTRDGLGHAVIDETAGAMLAMMDNEVDPEGKPWSPLSRKYAAWKSEHFPGNPMAVLYGLMKTQANIVGETRVADRLIEMEFGTSDEAKAEAGWFQEGNPNQPPRPFYALGDYAIEVVDRVMDDRFETVVR